MHKRLLALLSTVGIGIATALVAAPVAHSSPTPPLYEAWPTCTSATDNYCVASATRNGAPIAAPGTGERWYPWVDLLDSGTVRFGVYHDVTGDGTTLLGDVPAGDTYSITVRTGTIHPRELYGNIRNVDLTVGTDSTGWTFTLTFQPTPVHWVGYNNADGDGPDSRTCSVMACGDDTWAASLNYDGFVTGYVTDLASSGLSAAEIGWRTGMVRAYNANDENTYYDPDTNAFVIQLANPHLVGPRSTPGGPATGSYQAFFPDAYLINVMNVPDPSALSTGSFTLTRTVGGTTTSAPFTVTRETGGVEISIPSITYSRPTYRIRPRPMKPGVPRAVRAHKSGAHTAVVRFRPPAADGGRRVNGYQARCHRAGTPWHVSGRRHSPITVAKLPRGRVLCEVRAHNAKGYGRWSKPARS